MSGCNDTGVNEMVLRSTTTLTWGTVAAAVISAVLLIIVG